MSQGEKHIGSWYVLRGVSLEPGWHAQTSEERNVHPEPRIKVSKFSFELSTHHVGPVRSRRWHPETFSTVMQGMIPCLRISILRWSNESQATNQEVWKDHQITERFMWFWRHLKKEDKGDADGSAHAEGLKAGHDGEGPEAEGHDVGDGGNGDGDARMPHCMSDLEEQDVKGRNLSVTCPLWQGKTLVLFQQVVPTLHDDKPWEKDEEDFFASSYMSSIPIPMAMKGRMWWVWLYSIPSMNMMPKAAPRPRMQENIPAAER